MDQTAEKVIVSAVVPAATRARLEQLAVAGDRSLSAEIGRAVREHLERSRGQARTWRRRGGLAMWFGRKIEASDGSFAITGRKVTPPEPARMVIGPPSYWREVGPTVRGGGETGRSLSVGTLEEKVIRGDTSEVDFLRAERTRTEERLQRQRITRHGPSTLPPTLVARLRRLGIRA